MSRDLPKGDIPILILTVLDQGPCHGYAIAREIERQSGQSLRMREGSLYPALRVLEQEELVTSEWETVSSGPARKVYRITETGRGDLKKRVKSWKKYVKTITGLLGGLSDASSA